MSGGNPGGYPNVGLKPKQGPSYQPANTITSEKNADYNGALPGGTTKMKLGIRVKQGQTATLELKTRSGTPINDLTPLADNDPVIGDLTTALGCDTQEKWLGYTFTWQPSFGAKFDSKLKLDPFPPPQITDNGFQVVTIAFCHGSQTFSGGIYTYAVSVLPGKHSQGFPLSVASAPSKEKSPKTGAKKSKSTNKKSPAGKKSKKK